MGERVVQPAREANESNMFMLLFEKEFYLCCCLVKEFYLCCCLVKEFFLK